MTPARFAGRRALVTGASRGIGASLAAELAAQGADVAVVARTLDAHPTLPGSLRETTAAIEAQGRRAVAVVADLSDADERARIVPAASEGLGGPVEILVNNAAAAIYQPVAAFPLKRRRLIFEVNVHAPLDLAQAVVPPMVDAGEGWIVNVSSASARMRSAPFPATALGATIGVYGASKAALNRLSNALAEELWGSGVRVNTVEPRNAVRSEGAEALVGGALADDLYESMEDMVAGALLLCDAPPEWTGGTHVSLDLLGR
ncbi:MAG: SDR family NAD(P)-dependent oxidoreductase [Acidimicrobiales bacterium]|nr:SDR family NAD(P)-dependent oxidoreductase [Acidimicrobiales bacterium]MCB9373245.1 SDR family NAD(P)-dependent oxidoreductase [Microthrixaceae bacterium]